MTQEERNEYWEQITEEEVKKQYKPSTIKFAADKFLRTVDNLWVAEKGIDDPNFLLHEVGCSYTISSQYLDLPKGLPYLGSDPAVRAINMNCKRYQSNASQYYRSNTFFEVGTVEQMYDRLGDKSATMVASVCMFGSLSHDNSLDLMVMCGKMAKKVYFLVALHNDYNPSMTDSNWKGKRKYTSFCYDDMNDVLERLTAETKDEWELDIVHPPRKTNFAATFRRK